MKEFESSKYHAIVGDNGTLTVRNGPRVLRETTISKNGRLRVKKITQKTAPDESTRQLLANMNRMPVFCACWGGGHKWHVDIDCGFQRFNGVKANSEVLKALENCMFDQEQIDEIVALCKETKHKHCPRQW